MTEKCKVAFRNRSTENARKVGFSVRIGNSVVLFNNGEADVDEETATFVRKNLATQFLVTDYEDVVATLPEPVAPKAKAVGVAVGSVVEDAEAAAPKTTVKVRAKTKKSTTRKPKKKKDK